MTFLNSKKKVLPQEPTPCFFVVSSCYFFAFYEQAKHCSACKTSLIMLLSLSVHDLSQSRDFSRSKGLSSSQGLLGFHNGVSFCPSGGGGGGRGGTRAKFGCKRTPEGLKPDPVQDKKSFNTCPVQDNTLNFITYCLGQRTNCTSSC